MATDYTQGYNNGLVTGFAMGFVPPSPAKQSMFFGFGADPTTKYLPLHHRAENFRVELGFAGTIPQPIDMTPLPVPAGLPLALTFSDGTTRWLPNMKSSETLRLTLEFSDPGGAV
jgi:hypothetical protein